MRILYIAPYFGQHKYAYLKRMCESMGAVYPGEQALAATQETVIPFAGGPARPDGHSGRDIFLRNNNTDNIGFTRAINLGMRYGLAHGYDLLWSGNDDLEFPDIAATLRAIEEEFSNNPKTGIAGCQLVYTEEPDFIYHGGTTRAFPTGWHKSGRRSLGELAVRTKERWVAGGCMIVSRVCAQTVGLMDEHFFNIASDSDYCYRARLAGFDVVYLPTPVMHPRGSMTQEPKPEQAEKFNRDIEYFAQKWLSGGVFTELDSGPL